MINGKGYPGGAIYNKANLTIINCTFKNNNGTNMGGAIYSIGNLSIENSNFINNTVEKYGGAIYTSGKLYINNSNFQSNSVTNDGSVGGAISLRGTGYINNTVFNKQYTAFAGAGIGNNGNLTINNCSFTSNTGVYGGGAFSNTAGILFMNNSYIGYNDLGTFGAALIIPPNAISTEIHNTIIEYNHAGMHGAVVNSWSTKNNTVFYQCAFIGNYLGDIPKNPGISYGDITADGNLSLLNCWWGTNIISPYYDCDSIGYLNASTWLVMNLTADNLRIGKLSTLCVDLKHYYDNNTKTIKEISTDINLPLNVRFYTDNGEIANVTLVNGVATIQYFVDNNVKTVYAQINNQTLSLNVSTNPYIYLDLISNTSTKVNETFDLVFNLVNNGTATGKYIVISLNNTNTSSLKLNKLTVNGNDYNYTINNDNLIIKFDELVIGNKTIVLSLKTLATGEYPINIDINSSNSTINANTNSSLNISIISSTNNNTNTSNTTNNTNNTNTTNNTNNTNKTNNHDNPININKNIPKESIKNNYQNSSNSNNSENSENSNNPIAMEKTGNPILMLLLVLLSLIPIKLRKK